MDFEGYIVGIQSEEKGVRASIFFPYAVLPDKEKDENVKSQVGYYNYLLRGLRNDGCVVHQIIDLRELEEQDKKKTEEMTTRVEKDISEPQ